MREFKWRFGNSRNIELNNQQIESNDHNCQKPPRHEITESDRTLRLIVDDDANVLASSRPLATGFKLPKQKVEELFRNSKGYVLSEFESKKVCMAHAKAPGFETYSTGWHSILIQEIE